MFTECPDCRTAFRLTATVLRQAQGQVRCGGCGNTFNALDHLSEDLPDDHPSNTQTAKTFDRQSRALLDSLDDYAGRDNVRIQDTGVEWRVLDVEGASDNDENGDTGIENPDVEQTGTLRWTLEDADLEPDPASGASPAASGASDEDTIATPLDEDDSEADDDAGEMRFDDHTPLPDDFYRPADQPGFRSDNGARLELSEPPGLEPKSDEISSGDDDTGDEGDWEDLLAEFGLDESDDLEIDAAAGPESNEDVDPGAASGTNAVRHPEQAMSFELTGDEAGHSVGTGPDGGAQVAEPVPEEDALARSVEMEIDQELMKAAADTGAINAVAVTADENSGDENIDAEDSNNTLVESIVMEGDTVTDLLLEASRTTLDDNSLATNNSDERQDELQPSRRRIAMITATVLLALTLTVQLVHANRASLATLEVFNNSIGPVYRVFGNPVTPAWDISGWQFESTSGSTDETDQQLTIYSKISNRSEQPLPYPLVHLSLTDRFEEVVGSRVLMPQEYLAGNSNPNRPVAPGAGFTAVIAVDAPSPDATGFKLNVCYRLSGDNLRCAIEDFRD